MFVFLELGSNWLKLFGLENLQKYSGFVCKLGFVVVKVKSELNLENSFSFKSSNIFHSGKLNCLDGKQVSTCFDAKFTNLWEMLRYNKFLDFEVVCNEVV